jgi:hypothetical protein
LVSFSNLHKNINGEKKELERSREKLEEERLSKRQEKSVI